MRYPGPKSILSSKTPPDTFLTFEKLPSATRVMPIVTFAAAVLSSWSNPLQKDFGRDRPDTLGPRTFCNGNTNVTIRAERFLVLQSLHDFRPPGARATAA